jgi:cytochrome c oxidase subunit 2
MSKLYLCIVILAQASIVQKLRLCRLTHKDKVNPMNQLKHPSSGFAGLCLLLSSCTTAPAVIAPQGPAAAEISKLWWLSFWIATAVFIVVIGLLLYALFRPRTEPTSINTARDKWLIIGGGIVVPVIILVSVYLITLNSMVALAEPNQPEPLVIQVEGHQWWWEVHYPAQAATTANEIHIPVGQPVRIELTTADVIHSFWVPELQGKIDMIPGQTNTLWLQADQPGAYKGECAEFCGVQHARMSFWVIADPPDQFATWLQNQSQPAAEPADPLAQAGQTIFLNGQCANCHTIRGTNATGTLGPDLTHMASRQTIAAGSVVNNRGHLTGWISDPHSLKPGNLMPPTNLTGPDLLALVAYLESLL